MATQVGASLLQKCLIINLLQRYNAHTSLEFYRLRGNRFGENRLTDACRTTAAGHALRGAPRRALLAPARRRIFETQKPAAAESASGSIGLRGGSYCRRSDSPAAAGSGQQIANMAWRSNDNLGKSIAFAEMFDYESAHTSLQFYRRRSNRFGENCLTDACGAIFSKQAAPKSYAFFSCHEPLPPGTRCGGAPRRALLAPARRRIFETQKAAAAKSVSGSIGLCGGSCGGSYCRRANSAGGDSPQIA